MNVVNVLALKTCLKNSTILSFLQAAVCANSGNVLGHEQGRSCQNVKCHLCPMQSNQHTGKFGSGGRCRLPSERGTEYRVFSGSWATNFRESTAELRSQRRGRKGGLRCTCSFNGQIAHHAPVSSSSFSLLFPPLLSKKERKQTWVWQKKKNVWHQFCL